MGKVKPMHGMSKARGCEHLRLGNFCKLFPKLPTWADDFGIKKECEADEVAEILGGPGGIMHDAQSDSPDSGIPAGYTFFAQFIDHDITLDVVSKLHGPELSNKEIDHLPNMRSASLDLDCVYGFGPEANPFLYDQTQAGRMLVGNKVNENDLPRNKEGRALIGDPRNDENIFVAQLQLMFLKFHNRRIIGRSFEDTQLDVRYHYQWIVWYDFLKRVCDPAIYDYVQQEIKKKDYPRCTITDKCGRLCMPVEFSVAAYRFGHTMVRSVYPANSHYPVIDLFDERFGTEGFSPVPPELTVDWRFLLDVEDCHEYVKSKALDVFLADELIRLPNPVVGQFASENDRSLAFRNLLRGYVLGLASGQRVAQALKDKGYPLDDDPDLKYDDIPGWSCIDKATRNKLEKHTPLFFYLMREAGVLGSGERLGPVASAILLEVFGAMLLSCEHSILHDPHWRPDHCISGGDDLTLADIARYVG